MSAQASVDGSSSSKSKHDSGDICALLDRSTAVLERLELVERWRKGQGHDLQAVRLKAIGRDDAWGLLPWQALGYPQPLTLAVILQRMAGCTHIW
jgi:hypothetical protein